jgi:hypothetical protein
MWHGGDYLLIESWTMYRLPPKFGAAAPNIGLVKNFSHTENLLWNFSINC